MIERASRALVGVGVVLSVCLPARAESPELHARAAASHAVTEPQLSELGWGGGGAIVADFPLAKFLGVSVGGSALGLSQGAPPKDPSFAQRQAGTIFGLTGALRLSHRGVWIDGGGGVAFTGSDARPMIVADVGYDAHLRGPWYFGPYIGYAQVIEPVDSLRPGDARILLFGIQITLGEKKEGRPPVFLAKNSPKPRPDTDRDGVLDDEDACPIVAGVRTGDPRTNGCPADRDQDGIADGEDACPDVVGIPTPREPSTNGCPPTAVKLAGDRIELPDRIYFDFDSPRIKDRSLPLLKQIAEYISARGDIERVDVDGFADQIGTEEYNLELSRLRAENVKAWLIRYGVAAHLVTHAYGQARPRVHGHTIEELSGNRRVEFYVQKMGDAAFAEEEGPHASN